MKITSQNWVRTMSKCGLGYVAEKGALWRKGTGRKVEAVAIHNQRRSSGHYAFPFPRPSFFHTLSHQHWYAVSSTSRAYISPIQRSFTFPWEEHSRTEWMTRGRCSTNSFILLCSPGCLVAGPPSNQSSRR
jgi:hypothetical protein